MNVKNILWLIGWSVIAFLLALHFRLDYFFSVLLFFGPPAVGFSLQKPVYIRRALIFALCLTLPLMSVGEYLAVTGHAWYVSASVLPLRFFGYLPIEDIILSLFLVYSIVIWYESAFITGHSHATQRRMLRLICISIALTIILAASSFFGLDLSLIPDVYLWLAVFVLIPPIGITLFLAPYLAYRYALTLAAFGIVLLLFEFVGTLFNYWIFPGTYIGMMTIFGVHFPVEELIFWIALFPVGVLAYYELYDDAIGNLSEFWYL